MTDLEDQKLREAALRESQQIILAILNAVPARIFWKDKNLVYLGCNTPFARDMEGIRLSISIPVEKGRLSHHGFPLRLFAATFAISVLAAVVGAGLSWQLNHRFDEVRARDNQLKDYISQVRLFDEVLTMSARMAAATGNSSYKDRYDKYDAELDALIKTTARALGLSEVRQFVEQTDEANRTLVEMERRAFALASEGQRTEATALLVSDEYLKWKRVYAGGLERTVAWQRDVIATEQRRLGYLLIGVLTASSGIVVVLLLTWYFALHAGRRWGQERLESEAALRKAHDELEQQVSERTADLQSQNLRFDAALNNMVQGLLMFDSAGALIVSNRRFSEMFGLPTEQWKASALGLTVLQIIDLTDCLTNVAMKNKSQNVAELQNILDRGQAGALVFELTNGRTFGVSCSPMPDGGFVITLDDTTEQRRTQDQISHMAHYDALTDLPNRIHFYEEMDTASHARAAEQAPSRSSAWISTISRASTIHSDIRSVTSCCRRRRRGCAACVREADIVARLGGDEFAIVQVTFERPHDATSLATRLIDAMSAPYQLDGHQVIVGASIGIAIAPGDGTAPDQLMKNADLALYRCKADGGNVYRFFEAQMDARMRERRALELDLRKALMNGEFALNYQPIVNLKTGRVTACEALIRWHQPERGLVPPLEFIPIAEETGLIVPIGEWVLERACTDAVEWPDEIAVAVNVSPVQFKTGDFVTGRHKRT